MSEQAKTLVPKLRFPDFLGTKEWPLTAVGSYIEEYRKNSTSQDEFEVLTSARDGLIRQRDYFDNDRITERDNIGFNVIPPNFLTYRSRSDDRRFYFNENLLDITGIISTYYPVFNIQNGVNKFFIELLSKYSEHVGKHSVGTSQTVLSLNVLKKIELPIPSPSEQQKIADCLSSLDDLITAQIQKVEALKQHKKGLMQQLFPAEGETVPKLRFPEFENADEWKDEEIGNIFKVTRGEVLSMSLVLNMKTNEAQYPVYSSQTKNNGLAGFYKDYLFENAITWTTDGANAGDVNFRKGKFYCTNVCGVLLNDSGYANAFTAALLNTVTKNYVSYVGNPKLMNGVMAKIKIPFPSIPEQQKISDYLCAIDDLIVIEGQKLEIFKEHKTGLMQQLFPEMNGVER